MVSRSQAACTERRCGRWLTCPCGTDPEPLGPLPGNVHAEPRVEQRDVLAGAAAVLCHGGSGTTFGALAAGVPLVVVPLFADQPANGRLVASLGAGRIVQATAGPTTPKCEPPCGPSSTKETTGPQLKRSRANCADYPTWMRCCSRSRADTRPPSSGRCRYPRRTGITVHRVEPTASREAYRNKWITVKEHDLVFGDGSTGMYGVVEKPDFALVIPQDEDGRFCLVEQYRYPVGRRAWEFPQGSWSGSAKGDAAALAAAELREETGLTAGTLRHLGRLNPEYGFCNHAFDAYLATDVTAGACDREASEQDMLQAWFREADFLDMVRRRDVVDAASVAAYLLLLMHRGDLAGKSM